MDLDPAPSNGSHLYYAYGSNVCETKMAERCPGAVIVDVARLDDHRFVINERGVATVVPESGTTVHGLLWTISDENLRALDVVEGLDVGHYTRERTTVIRATGTPVEAEVYVACQDQPGPPRPGYLELVIDACRARALPAPYLDELAGWFTPATPDWSAPDG